MCENIARLDATLHRRLYETTYFGTADSVEECTRLPVPSWRASDVDSSDYPSIPNVSPETVYYDQENRRCFLRPEAFLEDHPLDKSKVRKLQTEITKKVGPQVDDSIMDLLFFSGVGVRYYSWSDVLKGMRKVCGDLRDQLLPELVNGQRIHMAFLSDDYEKSNSYMTAVAWWLCGLRGIIMECCKYSNFSLEEDILWNERSGRSWQHPPSRVSFVKRAVTQAKNVQVYCVFVDDASYSGSQLFKEKKNVDQMMAIVGREPLVATQGSSFHCIVLVPFATSAALTLAEEYYTIMLYHERILTTRESISGMIAEVNQNAHSDSEATQRIEQLNEVLDALKIRAGDTTLTYFQHKLPDDASTIQWVLNRLITGCIEYDNHCPVPPYKIQLQDART